MNDKLFYKIAACKERDQRLGELDAELQTKISVKNAEIDRMRFRLRELETELDSLWKQYDDVKKTSFDNFSELRNLQQFGRSSDFDIPEAQL